MIPQPWSPRTSERLRTLVGALLSAAQRGLPWNDFLAEATRLLWGLTRTGTLTIRLQGSGPGAPCRAVRRSLTDFRLERERPQPTFPGTNEPPPSRLCRALLRGIQERLAPWFTARGSLHAADVALCPPLELDSGLPIDVAFWGREEGFRSLVLIPLVTEERGLGVLQVSDSAPGGFGEEVIRCLEEVAGPLALALSHYQIQWALSERVKELTCLYRIAQATGRRDQPTASLLAEIAGVLPQGWQYPEFSAAHISLDGESFVSPGFVPSSETLSAPVMVRGIQRGQVEVVYFVPQPDLGAGPFLPEEETLIREVARQVGLAVENREADAEQVRLQEQLQHADRLATIGKLTASFAHELNEPLGSILGFAQLAQKNPQLPGQTAQDLGRIVKATLHAREIVKKLMLFGRPAPPRAIPSDFNALVDEGISFLESRFASQGVQLVRDLCSQLPAVNVDPGQLRQVVVNLIANALQAMPKGGRLTLRTAAEPGWVSLSVLDSGTGIPPEILAKIFEPFFTTKETGEGTGLGLTVVKSIVGAHGGTIDVNSTPGDGTRFDLKFPAHEVTPHAEPPDA